MPYRFQRADSEAVVKAIWVAEMDATRRLTERVYGVAIDADTLVYDLVLADDQVAARIDRLLKGARTVEGPIYREDGQVWVVKAVTLHTVLEEITRYYTHREINGERVRQLDSEQLTQRTEDVVIDALGNGALPDSPGLAKIQAKRAAEIDAYRRLTQRMLGVRVNSGTKVRDFMLESDMLHARVTQILKGAKAVDIVYGPDGTCQVTMQVKLSDIYRVIEHYAGGEIVDVDIQERERTLSATGYGAPRPADYYGSLELSANQSDRGTRPGTIIVKELIDSRVVVD